MPYGIKIYKDSYSPNVVPSAKNLFNWLGTTGANNCTVSADTSTSLSPVGGVPLKMVVTGNDPHIQSYGNSGWTLDTAAAGDTWTISVYAKASVATTIQLPIGGMASNGSTIVESGAQPGDHSIGTSWTRVSYTYTMTNASTRYIQCRLDGPNSGGSGTTVWFDGLQLELGNTATTFRKKSYINASNSFLSGRVFLGLLRSTQTTGQTYTDVPYAVNSVYVYVVRAGNKGYQITNTSGYTTITFVDNPGSQGETILAVFAKNVNEPTYGMSITNVGGDKIASTKYPVPVFIGKVQLDSTAYSVLQGTQYRRYSHSGTANLGSTSATKLILYSLPDDSSNTWYGNPISVVLPSASSQVNPSIRIYTNQQTYTVPEAFVFQVDNLNSLTSSHTYGIQLKDSSGAKTFDSGLEHAEIKKIYTYDITNPIDYSGLLIGINKPLMLLSQYEKTISTYDGNDTSEALYVGVIKRSGNTVSTRSLLWNQNTIVGSNLAGTFEYGSKDSATIFIDGNELGIGSGSIANAITLSIAQSSGSLSCSYTAPSTSCTATAVFTATVTNTGGVTPTYSWSVSPNSYLINIAISGSTTNQSVTITSTNSGGTSTPSYYTTGLTCTINVGGATITEEVLITFSHQVSDTTKPTISISGTSSLQASASTTLTFTTSETTNDFTSTDIIVSAGTISNFTGSGTSYTATYTAPSTAQTVTVSVPAGSFTDNSGNTNTVGSKSITITSVSDIASVQIKNTSGTTITSLSAGQEYDILITMNNTSASNRLISISASNWVKENQTVGTENFGTLVNIPANSLTGTRYATASNTYLIWPPEQGARTIGVTASYSTSTATTSITSSGPGFRPIILNQNPANLQVLTSGLHVKNNIAWYKFLANGSPITNVTAFAAGNTVDTEIALYKFAANGPLIAQNDDYNGFISGTLASVAVESNVSYYIAVGRFNCTFSGAWVASSDTTLDATSETMYLSGTIFP